MYIFGKSSPSTVCDQKLLQEAFISARQRTQTFAATPIKAIIDTLHRLGKTWQRDGVYWQRAFEMGRATLPFSDDMLARSLDVIPGLLDGANIMARIKSDFGGIEKLDQFVQSHAFSGRERAFPLGVLFHVSAGNVFLGAIDSLLMGFLTKNVSIVKLSSRNIPFPLFFAHSLVSVDPDNVLADKFALIHFPGGEAPLEALVKKEANGIIAWGGEEMILSYKNGLGLGVKFVEYGPKISFQVVTRSALAKYGAPRVGEWIAHDIAMWDQAACASPQDLFVESGIDAGPLLDAVADGLERFPCARGRLSDDEHVEILKEKARARYSKIMAGGDYRDGGDYLLHLDPQPGLRTSPLNRSLIVKRYDSATDLVAQLGPYTRHLQSCSMLAMEAEEDALANALGSAGVMRFARLGHVMEAPIGAPHDGRMTLMELTRIVPEEVDSTLEGFANDAIANVPFYRDLRGGRLVGELSEMPLIKGSDLDTGSEEKLSRFVHGKIPGGYVFSSGGTSGSPKYMVYTHDEFGVVAEMLATAFRAQGVRPGSVVANLFVAGNLWSSFMAVDQAMARIGARVLPIGGMADKDQTITWLERFRPEFVVGLPTQIIELVRRAEATGRQVKIPAILYGGEHLTLSARKFLSRVAGTAHFGSAGYASVDAGPIGYQCRHCEGGVHHLFASQVHLEVIEGEGVVTSRVKRTMPVIRLRTGDLIEWLPDAVAGKGALPCACGSADPRFRLLGRADSQFNVWGCRLFINDIEKAIADCDLGSVLFQLHLQQDQAANEEVLLHVELSASVGVDEAKLKDMVYQHSRDLAATHPRQWLDQRLRVIRLPEGGIKRVERTGKIKVLVDHR